MAFDPQSSKWADIVKAIAAQIISTTGLDPSCVRIVASEKYDLYIPAVGSRAVTIRYFGPEPDTDAGVGRRARRLKRLVRIQMWTRDSLDLAGEDVTALFQDGGHSDFEEEILNALDEFWPMSTDQTPVPLTVEPLHPLNSAETPQSQGGT